MAVKTTLILLVLILKFGISWKNRRENKKIKINYNVMSLNQTILLLVLLYVDNTYFPYFILDKSKIAFNMEMLRLICIENIFFRFLLPIYMIIDSKSKLPALWVENHERKLQFFMTSFVPSPRQVVTRYHKEKKAPIRRNRKVTFGKDVIINICTTSETCISLPDVEIWINFLLFFIIYYVPPLPSSVSQSVSHQISFWLSVYLLTPVARHVTDSHVSAWYVESDLGQFPGPSFRYIPAAPHYEGPGRPDLGLWGPEAYQDSQVYPELLLPSLQEYS